jgi:hypothetical protein
MQWEWVSELIEEGRISKCNRDLPEQTLAAFFIFCFRFTRNVYTYVYEFMYIMWYFTMVYTAYNLNGRACWNFLLSPNREMCPPFSKGVIIYSVKWFTHYITTGIYKNGRGFLMLAEQLRVRKCKVTTQKKKWEREWMSNNILIYSGFMKRQKVTFIIKPLHIIIDASSYTSMEKCWKT